MSEDLKNAMTDLYSNVSFSGGGGGGEGGGGGGRVTARDGSRTNISPSQQAVICGVAGGIVGGATSRVAGPELGGAAAGFVGTTCASVDNGAFNDAATGFLGTIGGAIADGYGMGL